MHAVLRKYSGEGVSELFEELEGSIEEIERIILDVPGFVSYTLFRTSGGGASLTVCTDKEGTDESSRRAAEWVKENVNVRISPPEISEGSTVMLLS